MKKDLQVTDNTATSFHRGHKLNIDQQGGCPKAHLDLILLKEDIDQARLSHIGKTSSPLSWQGCQLIVTHIQVGGADGGSQGSGQCTCMQSASCATHARL